MLGKMRECTTNPKKKLPKNSYYEKERPYLVGFLPTGAFI